MATSLAVVETPFQLLCANEYLRRRDPHCDLLVRKLGATQNDIQLDNVLATLSIRPQKEIVVRSRSTVDVIRAVALHIRQGRHRTRQLVLGSYFSRYQRTLARFTPFATKILLDDGTSTLLADRLIAEGHPGKYGRFSIFELCPDHYVFFEKHSFETLRAEHHSRDSRAGNAVFIGQNLVELQLMSMRKYVSLVERAARIAQGELFYIPHRSESPATLASVDKISGIRVRELDLPLEVFFLRNDWHPSKIFTVSSTALFTLAVMFPEASAYAFFSPELQEKQGLEYTLIVDYFASHTAINLVEPE